MVINKKIRTNIASITVIIAIILIIFISFATEDSMHKDTINNHINSMNGNVVSIERRTLRTGPFLIHGKNTEIYKVIYIDNNKQTCEAWVKFTSGFFQTWVTNYKE